MSTREDKLPAPPWLLEWITAGVLVLDERRRVTYANGAVENILFRQRAALLGRPVADLFPDLSAEAMDRVLGGEAEQFPNPTDAQSPLGRSPMYQFAVQPGQEGAVLAFRDLGVLVRHEAETAALKATMAVSRELLKHKNDELNRSLEQMGRMNEQLAHLDNLKSEFLSKTSHELRTPLNAIIGSLQLVREEMCENRNEEQEYIQTALDSSKHLLTVINDVLDSANLSAEKMSFMIEEHCLETVFDEIYSLLAPLAQQKGLKLEFGAGEEHELSVRADFEKLKQVLINLVGNGIKYTEDGAVSVRAAIHPDQSDMVRIDVTDTVIGIPEELRDVIFERFTQGDGTGARNFGAAGLGLGLAITKNLVELMGGTIEIDSPGRNQGTVVRFTMPRGQARKIEDNDAESVPENWDQLLPRTF